MDFVIPKNLMQLLSISVVFSMLLMAFIQKCKTLSFIKSPWQIWILNLVFSFVLGIPFGMLFYHLSWIDSIWIGLFGFIGAPSLYASFKNYNPASLSEINKQDNISS